MENAKPITLSFDLDNTIFDTFPIMKLAFERAGEQFYFTPKYEIEEAYSPKVAQECYKLFQDKLWYETKLLHPVIPMYLNLFHCSPLYQVYYVTQRSGRSVADVVKQLRDNDIRCDESEIKYNISDKTSVLKELGVKVHFDDSPHVVESCLKHNIPVHMISTELTPYNHYLRDKVNYSTTLVQALERELKFNHRRRIK